MVMVQAGKPHLFLSSNPLFLVPTAAMTFIVLGDEIWSPQIHCPKFVTRAFPPLARIQFYTHRLPQKGFISIGDISKFIVVQW